MSVLAERVLLSRSGITRLVDRLVAAGFVERSACVSDARGAEAALTARGLERLRAASQTHLDGVQRYFLGLIAGPGPRRHRARLQRDPRRAGPRGDRRLVVHDRERLTPRAGRPGGRAARRHERLRLPGLGAALLPAGPARDRTCSPTTRRGCPRVELNNTFYARPTAARIAAWVAATPPGFRFVVKAQRGASRPRPLRRPRRSRCRG